MGCLGGLRYQGEWGMTDNEYRIAFGDDEIVLKLIVVQIVHLCEYTKKIKLYALNMEIVWYLNYNSVKLLVKIWEQCAQWRCI